MQMSKVWHTGAFHPLPDAEASGSGTAAVSDKFSALIGMFVMSGGDLRFFSLEPRRAAVLGAELGWGY